MPLVYYKLYTTITSRVLTNDTLQRIRQLFQQFLHLFAQLGGHVAYCPAQGRLHDWHLGKSMGRASHTRQDT